MTQTGLHKFFQAEESEDLKFSNSMIKVMEQHNNADFSEFLYEKGLITSEENNRIKEMIYSPDSENYELAKALLQEKSRLVTIAKYGYQSVMFKDRGVIK